MAQALSAQAALSVAIGTDASLRRTGFKGSNKIHFTTKSGISTPTLSLKNREPKSFKIHCMSVPQTTKKTKIAVKPLELELPKDPPLNLHKPKTPYTGTIVSVERLVGPKAPGETCHIVIDHDGNVPYWEGQSFGIIPPGENKKKPGQPNNVRLYSIASTRYGDSFDGKTGSLCVRRAVYYDPETGKEDPSKNGVCSNFLCDSKPGDKIQMTGPSGKIMLLPEDDPKATHIMIATGTGVAPYRGYLRRMFMEDVPTFHFNGLAWLFLGVANTDSLLYHDEFQGYLRDYPDNFSTPIAEIPLEFIIMINQTISISHFGYLRRMFMEDVPNFQFNGLAWLFLGVANTDNLLYHVEFEGYLRDYPDNFRYDIALSREQKNKTGGKMYVQDKIEEYSDEIFKLLDGGAHIYFCGLKGMMPGIQETLKRVAEQRGESWDQKLSQLKKNKQWHVEVY